MQDRTRGRGAACPGIQHTFYPIDPIPGRRATFVAFLLKRVFKRLPEQRLESIIQRVPNADDFIEFMALSLQFRLICIRICVEIVDTVPTVGFVKDEHAPSLIEFAFIHILFYSKHTVCTGKHRIHCLTVIRRLQLIVDEDPEDHVRKRISVSIFSGICLSESNFGRHEVSIPQDECQPLLYFDIAGHVLAVDNIKPIRPLIVHEVAPVDIGIALPQPFQYLDGSCDLLRQVKFILHVFRANGVRLRVHNLLQSHPMSQLHDIQRFPLVLAGRKREGISDLIGLPDLVEVSIRLLIYKRMNVLLFQLLSFFVGVHEDLQRIRLLVVQILRPVNGPLAARADLIYHFISDSIVEFYSRSKIQRHDRIASSIALTHCLGEGRCS